MNKMNYVAGGGAAVAAFALSAGAALAATEEGTVQVSATVAAACSIGDGTLAFGSIASINAGTAGTKSDTSDTDTDTGAVNYVCSNGATATLGISGANASTGQLRMKDAGTNFLAYNIYSDSERSTEFVPVGGTTPTALPLVADGTNQTVTLYGRVPGATANQKIGAYTDTLTLTVTYN